MDTTAVSVSISREGQPQFVIILSATACEAVRLGFNPSGIDTVHVLKALAGAFLTLADGVAQGNPSAAREIETAKTNMQTASMWAVLGATKGQ